MTQQDAPELHQFAHSHFNEKARWALDFKNVPHRRRTYLPGPHAGAIRKLSGASETPVLLMGGLAVGGSAAIIDALEAAWPEPALYPSDPETRREALALQARFDTGLGPAIRRALFAELVMEPGYLCRLFARHASPPVRLVYRALQPVTKGIIRSAMNLDDKAAVEAGHMATREALDFVAERAGPDGYLAGDRFSVADLTVAALLAPACNPGHPDMALPSPRPERIEAWLAKWDAHPGAEWVRSIYRKHRPVRAVSQPAAA